MKKISLQDILHSSTELGNKKVGYVAIIGRPNTGKSTFINTLIGEKVSITTRIPQTTRNKILAIYNDDESQILFFDTPGIHESQKSINQEMNAQALSSLQEADVILYFIDLSRSKGREEVYIESLLKHSNKDIFYVYTKSDLPAKITPDSSKNSCIISSIDKSGYDELLKKIIQKLPIGPLLFPQDFYTKQDVRFRISEIIREKLFLYLKQELPHSIFVSIEDYETSTTDLQKISAYIYTETNSQKYIIIGKGGSVLSQVGKLAREELEELLDKKIFLSLRVKVKKDWRKDEKFLKTMFR